MKKVLVAYRGWNPHRLGAGNRWHNSRPGAQPEGAERQPVAYAPPAPPLFLSALHSADQYAFGRFPPGWFGIWHPTPRRQFFFQSAGEVEVTVSDGEVRRFHPGSIILLEDTDGKGHITRVIGTVDVCAAFVQACRTK